MSPAEPSGPLCDPANAGVGPAQSERGLHALLCTLDIDLDQTQSVEGTMMSSNEE